MLRAVIFDMDGVIVDSHPIHKKSWRTFLTLQGKETSDEELKFIFDGRKKEDILRHFLGELSDQQIQLLGQQKEMLFREEAANIQLVEGISSFLEKLNEADIKLAIASSGSANRVQYLLDLFHLRRYFEAIITGDQVAVGKPDPAIFRLACDRVRMLPADTLVFEDSISGVRAAKAAEMKCVGVASDGVGEVLCKAGADYVMPDFTRASVDQMHKLFQ